MELQPFATEGLGDTSYLLASEGEAVLVDPQRDAWRFIAAAEARGWRISHVLETHVHNDYVSGALETRAATGAEIVAPARGGYRFTVRGADEGDVLEVGALRITALATPGHTPEHLAWLVGSVDDPEAPLAIFSGGSLLVGSAGRTDLLGPVLTDPLT
ncbi:MAG TPA: MBL fold metallo-hydrolase, partial [Candidatus Acidoferrales bacterium]|nr:MBL fold metallo-hydrolase [Candidatus Acidoferrales bacterium]